MELKNPLSQEPRRRTGVASTIGGSGSNSARRINGTVRDLTRRRRRVAGGEQGADAEPDGLVCCSVGLQGGVSP